MALVMLPALLTACEMRTISPYDVNYDEDRAHISLDVDWSLMDEEPTGMTVIFYPTDGSQPYTYVTNEVHHIERSLPETDYDILVFNQSVEEFSSIRFRGMDLFETAEAYVPESTESTSRLDRLYGRGNGSRGYIANSHLQPKSLGSASLSTKNNTKPTRGYIANSHLQPKPKVGQFSATVHVAGLQNAIRANGAITGLASGAYLSNLGGVSKLSLTQEIDDWELQYNEDGSIGSIHATIGTFGLSPAVGSRGKISDPTRSGLMNEYVEESEDDDYNNILYLNFLLKDGTYVSYRFDVTDAVEDYTAEVEVELVLDLGTSLEEYVELPETGLPYETSAVSVDSWGEEVIQEVHF